MKQLLTAISVINFQGKNLQSFKIIKRMRADLGKTKLMVSGMEEETFNSKIDPCGVCGTRVMSNSVLCTACGKWVHAKMHG